MLYDPGIFSKKYLENEIKQNNYREGPCEFETHLNFIDTDAAECFT